MSSNGDEELKMAAAGDRAAASLEQAEGGDGSVDESEAFLMEVIEQRIRQHSDELRAAESEADGSKAKGSKPPPVAKGNGKAVATSATDASLDKAKLVSVTSISSAASNTPGAYAVEHPDAADLRVRSDASEEEEEQQQPSQPEELAPTRTTSHSTPPVALQARLAPDQYEYATTANSDSIDLEQPAPPQHVVTEEVFEGVKEETVVSTRRFKDNLLIALAMICIGLLLIIIVIMILGFTGVISSSSSSPDSSSSEANNNNNVYNGGTFENPDMTPLFPLSPPSIIESNHKDVLFPNMTTLERIHKEGVLRCADVYLPNGFVYHDKKTGEKTGFYAELCHALAAAVGPHVKAIFVPQTMTWGFFPQLVDPLLNQTADVTIIGLTRNMERSVHVSSVNQGFTFSSPLLYGGLRMGGNKFYIENCVNKGLKHIDECRSLRICISNVTTHWSTAKTLLPERFFLHKGANGVIQFEGLLQGDCNVMAAGMFQMSHQNAAEQGVTNYSLSDQFFSKEPMSMVTNSDDPEWSNFVESVLQALYVAEHRNITQETADQFPKATSLFGELHQDAWRRALKLTGNYGELYTRFLEDYIPRSSLNLLNDGETGLLYALPWGKVHVDRHADGNDRPLGQTLQSILDRGALRCGIRLHRPGFANKTSDEEYVGMEVEMCRAVASGLFGGDDNAIEYVSLEGATEGFQKLAGDDVDLIAGAPWSIVNEVKEPSTGMGFTFSQPYFYRDNNGNNDSEEDNFALATRSDDPDWSNFVYWILSALVYAEEIGIHSNNSSDMPEVLLYGLGKKRMLRDAVLAVGNYGDIYERHAQPYYPRRGRNMLNADPVGPQNYPLPGYF